VTAKVLPVEFSAALSVHPKNGQKRAQLVDIAVMYQASGSTDPFHPSAEEVASVFDALPSAPNVLPRICGLLHEEHVSLQQLGTMLRLDPGLTARVLHLANELSAARGESCVLVEDAINRIGFDRICSLVAYVAKAQVFSRAASLYGIDAEELWRWSIACALGAEVLAESTGEDPSVAYTLGLLHSMGIVAIDEWALQHAPTLMFMSRGVMCEFVESERALLGFTQAEVGAAMMRRWSFPAIMSEPLRWQYTPHGSAGYARQACLLHAAKWLRSAVCAHDADRPPPLPDPLVLHPLRLTAERLARLVVEVRIRLGEVRNLVEPLAA
jgi:HD-like signal output (HDOD) protein